MRVDGLVAKATNAVSHDAVQSGLEELFDQLMAENGPALVRLAGAFTNTREDRDDLFQEMALAIWQALPGFRGESSTRTYLFRIAHNRATAYLIRRRMTMAEPHEEPAAPDPRPDPERQLGAEQQRREPIEAVRKLPFVYRDVIALALEGLSYREIAGILGVSEANVGARLSRARTALRTLLEKTT